MKRYFLVSQWGSAISWFSYLLIFRTSGMGDGRGSERICVALLSARAVHEAAPESEMWFPPPVTGAVSVTLLPLCTRSGAVMGSEPVAQGELLVTEGYSWSNFTAYVLG